jgi:hypothetical protein
MPATSKPEHDQIVAHRIATTALTKCYGRRRGAAAPYRFDRRDLAA